MKVKRPSAVVSPALMPRCSETALTMASLPQPPSWHGVYDPGQPRHSSLSSSLLNGNKDNNKNRGLGSP